MEDIKIFITKPASEIPPKSKDPFNSRANISDWHFGKTRNIDGYEQKVIVVYDFSANKWLTVQSRIGEVVEYYVENERYKDKKFQEWIFRKMPIETLYEIYSAMDEEDK